MILFVRRKEVLGQSFQFNPRIRWFTSFFSFVNNLVGTTVSQQLLWNFWNVCPKRDKLLPKNIYRVKLEVAIGVKRMQEDTGTSHISSEMREVPRQQWTGPPSNQTTTRKPKQNETTRTKCTNKRINKMKNTKQ